MNTDLLIACIIAGSFFLFLVVMFLYAFISEWVAVERMKKSDHGSVWTFAEK